MNDYPKNVSTTRHVLWQPILEELYGNSIILVLSREITMVTSSNGNIFRVTGPSCGNPPVTGGFPSRRPVTWSFAVFFDLCWTNGWASNRAAGDLRCHRTHYDVTTMTEIWSTGSSTNPSNGTRTAPWSQNGRIWTTKNSYRNHNKKKRNKTLWTFMGCTAWWNTVKHLI